MSNRLPPVSPEYLLNGKPSGLFREGVAKRQDVATDVAAALVTQIMTCVAVVLQKGDVITNITAKAGATAAGTPTNWWFALYDDNATAPVLLSQTADQLTAAWAANAVKTLALATPQEIQRAGVYYAAIMVKATTVPSLCSKVLPTAADSDVVLTGQKKLAVTSGSSLTTTAPATIVTGGTASVNIPYVVLT